MSISDSIKNVQKGVMGSFSDVTSRPLTAFSEQGDDVSAVPVSNSMVSSDFKTKVIEILPTRVGNFDELLYDKGFERGSTTLIVGGAGTGKTTFCIESLYHGALNGEKGVYLSFEEEPEKIMAHMKKNFGWDLAPLQKKGLFAIVKLDPLKIARQVEGVIESASGNLRIQVGKLTFPFHPDRVAVDSLSALSIAFRSEDSYRKYIRELFELLEEYNSVSLAIDETEQDPTVFSRTGVEEFLADGVIVLYNVREGEHRKNALEILKLRSGKHVKSIVPYHIGENGFRIKPTPDMLVHLKKKW